MAGLAWAELGGGLLTHPTAALAAASTLRPPTPSLRRLSFFISVLFNLDGDAVGPFDGARCPEDIRDELRMRPRRLSFFSSVLCDLDGDAVGPFDGAQLQLDGSVHLLLATVYRGICSMNLRAALTSNPTSMQLLWFFGNFQNFELLYLRLLMPSVVAHGFQWTMP